MQCKNSCKARSTGIQLQALVQASKTFSFIALVEQRSTSTEFRVPKYKQKSPASGTLITSVWEKDVQ